MIRLFAAVLLLIMGLVAPGLTQDIDGSADHPLVGRFEGAVITAYDFRDFDEYDFAREPITVREPDNLQTIEGVVTRIAYTLDGEQSLTEVARNYELGLTGRGFDIIFECKTKECGGGNFSYGIQTFPLPQMVVDPFNFRYLGAKKTGDSEVYAAVVISADTNKKVRIQVTVVETDQLAFKMVDAKAMQTAFAEKGGVALYGIYFDTDKADIKPESAPTLEEMALFSDECGRSVSSCCRAHRQSGHDGLQSRFVASPGAGGCRSSGRQPRHCQGSDGRRGRRVFGPCRAE